MKIDTVRLVGAKAVNLPLEGVGPLSPYVLKAADGLGPVGVDVSIVPTLEEGGHYNGRRPQLRQLVFRIGLQPEWNIGQTPQELRTELYGLLTPKYGAMVTVELLLANQVLATTQGHVSKIEIAVFSKDPEVQVTIECVDTYLTAPTASVVKPGMSGTPDTKFIVNNPGTAPSGFRMDFVMNTSKTGITLYEDVPGGASMAINGSFFAGDGVIIDTNSGSRGVWRKPAGVGTLISMLGYLSDTSTWLQLYNGDNPMGITYDDIDWATGIIFRPMYWGI